LLDISLLPVKSSKKTVSVSRYCNLRRAAFSDCESQFCGLNPNPTRQILRLTMKIR
jgi:hypothetical protein